MGVRVRLCCVRVRVRVKVREGGQTLMRLMWAGPVGTSKLMSTKHPVVASTNLMIGTRAVAMACTLRNGQRHTFHTFHT